MEENFIKYIEQSIKDHWDLPALTDFKGATSSYKDVARKIEKLHLLFEHCGIRKGDKIALCSRNTSSWGIAFLATLSYGAVAVPILNEFKPTVRKKIPRSFPCRRCSLRIRYARPAGRDQLYLGHHQFFQRSDAALP